MNRIEDNRYLYRIAVRHWWSYAHNLNCPVILRLKKKRVPVDRRPHHIYGRIGSLLWWIPGFLAVSSEGWNWIRRHPTSAKKYGWLAAVCAGFFSFTGSAQTNQTPIAAVRVSAGSNSIILTNLVVSPSGGLFFRLKGLSWTNAVLQRTGWPGSGFWADQAIWYYPSNSTPQLRIDAVSVRPKESL